MRFDQLTEYHRSCWWFPAIVKLYKIVESANVKYEHANDHVPQNLTLVGLFAGLPRRIWIARRKVKFVC